MRGLCRNFNGTVTALCMAHVQELMAAYAAQPAGADAKKEAAIALVIALSAKVHTVANGGGGSGRYWMPASPTLLPSSRSILQ